jgi:hypothetical protein
MSNHISSYAINQTAARKVELTLSTSAEVVITNRYGTQVASASLAADEKWTAPVSIASFLPDHYPLTVTVTEH